MDRTERKQILGTYVRARLSRECESSWGRATEISRQIGFSSATISKIVSGERDAGPDFMEALGAYWGLSLEALRDVAYDYNERGDEKLLGPPDEVRPAERELQPNLRATIAWCRGGTYSEAFLREYEAEARKLRHDRPRELWLREIEVKYFDWKTDRRESRTGTARKGSDDATSTARRTPRRVRG